MNLSTIIVLAVLAACIVLSIRSLRKKGMCGCKEHCGGSCSSGCSSCASCSSCSASQRMVAQMEDRADDQDDVAPSAASPSRFASRAEA